MRNLLERLFNLAIIVAIIALFYYLPRFDQPGWVEGDKLSEHIVHCETCSNPILPSDACPTGVAIQAERSLKTPPIKP